MTRAQKFLTGLQIILKYEPDAEFAAEHDEIWFGTYRPEKMKADDKRMLEECGWTYDKDYDSWHHFV